jgi:PleD family two-component response regulator
MVVNRAADGTPLRMVGANTDISQLKAAEQSAWKQANFDTLTGLPNRRLF